MGHLIESRIARCTNPQHVSDDSSCTWLSVADVNQAGDYTLDGPMLRELGLALSEHYTSLVAKANGWSGDNPVLRDEYATRRDITDQLAKLLDVDRLESLMQPWQRGRNSA